MLVDRRCATIDDEITDDLLYLWIYYYTEDEFHEFRGPWRRLFLLARRRRRPATIITERQKRAESSFQIPKQHQKQMTILIYGHV